jgi:hypothetical protein
MLPAISTGEPAVEYLNALSNNSSMVTIQAFESKIHQKQDE